MAAAMMMRRMMLVMTMRQTVILWGMLGFYVQGSRSSFRSTGPIRYGNTTRINTRDSAASTRAVASDVE